MAKGQACQERRLTSPQFMEVYDKILKKDGTVEFKTDNRGLLIIPWNRYRRQDGIFLEYTFDLHHSEMAEECNDGV